MASGGCLDEGGVFALAEGRLPEPLLSAASEHLRSCADCRARIAFATAVSRAVVTEILGPPAGPGETGTEPVGQPRRHVPRRLELAAGAPIGRYTVLGLVGRGGMGEVYAAYDPSLDRKVALKLLLDDAYASDRNAQERLVREAQAIAKLSHPNVVVVHDVDTFHGRVFVAMEFVDGVTLSDWLKEKDRPWQEIVSVYLQAARGLSAAHRAGLVHRDFKPQNVMVATDGSVRVMDFGLARRIGVGGDDGLARAPRDGVSPPSGSDVLTRPGEYLGTPLYMAPEQFVGGAIDAAADQFSFCVALFWALYGVHPFGARSGSFVAESTTTDVQRSSMSTSTAAPARLQRVLARGLSVDPSSRWPSMDELAAALVRDPARRRRNVALAVAGIVGCVAAGTLMARITDGRRALCADGAVHLAHVWELPDGGPSTGSRREAVHGAIIKGGAGDGPRIWERVSTLLDAHIKSWLVSYRDACEATNVRHEQSPEILDLRMACLNDTLDATRALTDLLSTGDPRVVEHAAEAAATLEDFQRCSDVQQIRLGVRPPKDPLVRARVEALHKRLSDVKALYYEVGDRDGATSAADALLAQVKPLNYCPLEAEVMAVDGDAQTVRNPAAAQALLEGAITLAESCGHDRVVARAALALVELYLVRDSSRAEQMADLARGALARAGGDRRLEAWLANDVGNLRLEQGRLDEAKQQYERAIELKRLLLGPDHLDVAVSEVNLADLLNELGRNDEALKLVDRALSVERGASVGPYFLANALMSRGHILADLGQLPAAEAEFRRSVAVLGDEDREVNPLWSAAAMGLGDVLERRGADREAIHYLDRALRHVVEEDRFRIADAQFSLARARAKIDPAAPAIRDLALQAETTYAIAPAFAARRRAVAEWLARQPAIRAAKSSAARKLSGRAAPVPAMSNAVP